jgi:hypothetical protein
LGGNSFLFIPSLLEVDQVDSKTDGLKRPTGRDMREDTAIAPHFPDGKAGKFYTLKMRRPKTLDCSFSFKLES